MSLRAALAAALLILAPLEAAAQYVPVNPPGGGGGGTPGGSNTQLQYNNSSAFGGLSTAVSDGAGSIHFTNTTGTAPMTVDSTTVVTNLNAFLLRGQSFGSPGAIGNTTPGTGTFTTLTATSHTTSGTAGAGFYELTPQSAAPSTPAANTLRLFSDSTGRLNVIGSSGFLGIIDPSSLGANHTLTLPNVNGTITALGNAQSGTGSFCFTTSCVMVTPTLGVAAATTLNKWTFTAPATGITLTGTDNATYTMPTVTSSIQPVFAPAPASGRWFLPAFLQGGTGTAINATGTAQFAAFLVLSPVTVDQIAVRCTTAAASGNVQMAIYANSAAGKPTGTPLMSTASVSTTSTGILTPASFTGTPTLGPGLYWMGIAGDANAGAVAIFYTSTNTSSMSSYFVGTTTQANLLTATSSALGFTTPLTFGTWGDLTSATFTEVVTLKSAMPLLHVQ